MRSDTWKKIAPGSEQNAYLSPAAVAREAKDIEKTSQLSQKSFLASAGLIPMCDRLQYGRIFSAWDRNFVCQIPRRIRGANSVCQQSCDEMMLCMRLNKRGGSFSTLTSTLNFTWRFSG